MRATRTVLVALVVAAACGLATEASAQQQTAQQWWPNTLGNKWTFEINGQVNNGQKFDLEITDRSSGWAYIDGKDRFYGAGWGDRWFWMSTQGGSIWIWNGSTARYSKVFNLGVGAGNTFTSDVDQAACEDNVVWEVRNDNLTITTPVGRFSGCLEIVAVQPMCADAGLQRMVFAPGVGPVEYSWSNITGPITARLSHAMVDGTEYKQQQQQTPFNGVTTSLKIDKMKYHVIDNQMPIVPPGGRPLQPSTMHIRFEIHNDSQETLEYNYASGQRYDIAIYDDAGNNVFTWSANKLFTMATGAERVAPGDTLAWETSFELRRLSGDALPAGKYTVEMYNVGGPEKATAGFEIELIVAR